MTLSEIAQAFLAEPGSNVWLLRNKDWRPRGALVKLADDCFTVDGRPVVFSGQDLAYAFWEVVSRERCDD